MSKKFSVTNLVIDLQPGTERNLYGSWDFSISGKDKKGVKYSKFFNGFTLLWRYNIGNGVWLAQSSTAGINDRTATFSAPSNATQVQLVVTPIAQKSGKKNPNWKAESQWSRIFESFVAKEVVPSAPSTPSITISGRTVNATVSGYTQTPQVQIEIIENDATVWTSNPITLVTGTATYSHSGTPGRRYKARAIGIGSPNSSWSSYSSNVTMNDSGGAGQTTPSTPSVPKVSIKNYKITASLTNYSSANRVQIQIVENDSSLVKDQVVGVSYGLASVVSGGTIGRRYKARVRGVSATNVYSEWSSYSDNVTMQEWGGDESANPNLPSVPPTPTTTIEDNKFIARIDNYKDSKAQKVTFEILKNDSSPQNYTVNLSRGSASIAVSGVPVNVNYKARVRAFNVVSGRTYTTEWSNYSNNIKLKAEKPPAPSNLDIEINGRTLNAIVNGYSNTNVDFIFFQVVRDNKTVYATGRVRVTTSIAIFSVSNIPIGSEYKFRAYAIGVRGVNAGLNSEWSAYSKSAKTVPADVPKFTSIAALSSTAIKVAWNAALAAESYHIQYTFNHDGYVINHDFFNTGVDVTDAENIKALYYPATNLTMGKTYYFRIKAANSAGESVNWSAISSCIIGTTPDAPTTWSYTSVGIIGDNVVLNWVHNTQDGSDQTGARVYIKVVNKAGTVVVAEHIQATINNKTQVYTYSTAGRSDGDTIYWSISTRGTKGIQTEWGPKSTARSFIVYTKPELAISAGETGEGDYPVISSFPLDIHMVATPITQTPVAYYVTITSDEDYDVTGGNGVEIHVSEGDAIYQRYIQVNDEGNIMDLILNPGDLYLVNEIVYTITAAVSMSNGLTAEKSMKIQAQWVEDDVYPDADVEVDDEHMTAVVRPYCLDENEIETSSGYYFAIYRIDFDGSFTLIQEKIDGLNNVSVLDLHPSLDNARYRIVATNKINGLVSYEDVEATDMNVNYAVIQWGGTWKNIEGLDIDDIYNYEDLWSGTCLKLPYNIDISDDTQPDVTMVEYIGREHPVSYYGTQKGQTSSWKVDIKKNDDDTLRKIRALSIYPGDVYIREPSGTGYWANIKVSYSYNHKDKIIPVSFAITRVEGGA